MHLRVCFAEACAPPPAIRSQIEYFLHNTQTSVLHRAYQLDYLSAPAVPRVEQPHSGDPDPGSKRAVPS